MSIPCVEKFLEGSEVQDFSPIGMENARFNGSKLIGKDFNIEPTRFTGNFKTIEESMIDANISKFVF